MVGTMIIILLLIVSAWSWSKISRYLQDDINRKRRLNEKDR